MGLTPCTAARACRSLVRAGGTSITLSATGAREARVADARCIHNTALRRVRVGQTFCTVCVAYMIFERASIALVAYPDAREPHVADTGGFGSASRWRDSPVRTWVAIRAS